MLAAHDADGTQVVIRTFPQTFSADQRDRFLAALDALCQAPLEHPSIARPLACGLAQDDQPYVVHAYVPGTPVSDLAAPSDRPDTDVIINRVTYVAGALDFAAAAGVFHGALTETDIILSNESAVVSGLGIVQALELAGVPGFEARREDDVMALMAIARQMLGGLASPAVESLLSAGVPSSALAFAGALHLTINADADAALTDDADWGHADRADRQQADTAYWEPPEPSHLDAAPPFSDVSDLRAPVTDDFGAEPPDRQVYDVQLRPTEDKPAPPVMFGAPEHPAPVVASRRGSHSWFVVGAVALALGVLTGFAGGFFVGSETPPSAPAAESAGPDSAAPTSGQTYTDAAIDGQETTRGAQPPSQPSVLPSAPPDPEPQPSASPSADVPAQDPPAAPASPRDTPAAQSPANRTEREPATPAPRSGPAAIRVDSLPAGAQVFVDGRSVGYTPLVVADLAPGTHSIRMQLPGYRTWVNAVTLGPGARERVAASLEQ